MKKIFIITISLLSFVVTAQKDNKIKGNKNVISDERTFDYFSKLEINNKIKLTLKQGRSTKLEIEADENLHDVIESDVKSGTLVLSLTKRITRSKKFNLTLYVDDLDFIELNDNSELKAEGELEFFNLEVVLNDKSDLKIELETTFLKLETNERSRAKFNVKADSLEITMKESSRLKATIKTQRLIVDNYGNSTGEFFGKVDDLKLTANDNATFKGAELISDSVEVIAINKTDSYINAKRLLKISVKNKAEIYVFNNPEIIIKEFKDNSSIFKRESMTLLENL